MALKAVLWDVDGTLADTEHHGHRQAFNQAFAQAGLPWHWDGPTYRDLLAVSGGRERIRHFLAQRQQPPLAEAELEALMAAKQRAYADLARGGQLPLRPGVKRLVAEVAARGWPQALVTTSSRSAVAALLSSQGTAWASAFAFWICGEDVAAKKPSPEGYQRALERLNLPAAAVLALEDSPQGLAATRAAALPCLLTLGESVASVGGGIEAGAVHAAGDGVAPGWWRGARAAVDHLGEEGQPPRVWLGPPCPEARVTVPWLASLVEAD
ncbi:MAG: HAD-IA family hydrolase [Cyanobacteriota bacterium]